MITDRQIELIVGSLLHDIGKVVYRGGDGRNHSSSGYDFLRELKCDDAIPEAVLDCVRYHHGKYLKEASLDKDALPYVTYFADNVAAFTDRREAEAGEDGFDRTIPLDSVFNILNGNNGRMHYAMTVLDPAAEINYPTDENIPMDEAFYNRIIQNISDNLKGIRINEEYINSLLSVLEANLTYIPSSTSKRELADISLYDHVKMTAAIAACTEQYLAAKGEKDYREALFVKAGEAYKEEMFLLYSMDISGIQSFIYTVGEKGALKGLRARSFYLEIMMENIVDELLDKLALSRANLIYTGGGHCYILLPNTEDVHGIIENYEKDINEWLMDNFGTALYIGTGYAVASADSLRNVPQGSYSQLYLTISKMISMKKAHRYNADAIRKLNNRKHDGERECSVCRRIARLTEDKCLLCRALELMSGNILHEDYFTVINNPENNALPLPGGKYLVADSKNNLIERMEKDSYVRCYTKNNIYTGKHVTTRIWVGDYKAKDTFEELAEQAQGIKRIGILRADVDNLGSTFVSGFKRDNGDEKYVTLSRTAALSRQLSLFFKCYINKLLADGEEGILSGKGKRNVLIVYSGGDDVFLAGAWNDVIAAFVELRHALRRFAQGTLTISGGIGIYQPKHPINVMAKETAELESASKNVPGKDAVTLFDDRNHSYQWKEFEEKVIAEKLVTINDYFKQSTTHGMAFLYHLTELLRNDDDKIYTARYIYLLSRMEPGRDSSKETRDAYRSFAKKMYEWSRNPKDKKELITAIYLYAYLNRDNGEENEE